jgi:DNA-binding beta-propeller fold protein YncE
VVVDQIGTVYVVDSVNHRVIRWLKGSKSGSVIIGGRGPGSGIAQLSYPFDLAFDSQGNLHVYVADTGNHRVQLFTIDKSSCAKDSQK